MGKIGGIMKKPELLAPAGTFEKAKVAFMYGADAVYAGTNKLSLRTRTSMQFDDLVNIFLQKEQYFRRECFY